MTPQDRIPKPSPQLNPRAHRRASNAPRAKHPAPEAPWILVGLICCLLVNYHWYLPDFRWVPGDLGDARLVVFTLEHWFQVLRGTEPFFRLQMFYPDPNALAYADGLFLFGIPYSGLRLAGMDFFSSYQSLLIGVTGLGYLAWRFLLRRVMGVSAPFATLAAVLLSSLNALQLQADIGKLTAVHLFPILILLLWKLTIESNRHRLQADLAGFGFGAGLGLLFFTSYYPAWFFLFVLAVFGLVSLLVGMLSAGGRRTVSVVRTFIVRAWEPLVAATVGLGLALVPFFVTYAPLIRAGSSRGFDLILEFSPTLKDIVNVSSQNVAWSPMLRALDYDFGNRELQMGTPVLVLLIAAATAALLISRLRARGWSALKSTERFLILLCLTECVLVLLSLRFGDFSAWYAVYRVVPGASALRAVGRLLIMLDLVVIVLAVWGLQQVVEFTRAGRRPVNSWILLALGIGSVLLVTEQVNARAFQLDKTQQLQAMGNYKSPGSHCGAFYIVDKRPSNVPFGYHQLDAMMAGMHIGMPTVNGYSGFEPHDAFTLKPAGPEYQYRILDWLSVNYAMQGICELDMMTASFRSVDVENELPLAQREYRDQLLAEFSTLRAAAAKFLQDGRSPSDLYPQYLQERGYLDPGLGHGDSSRYRWIQDRYWIGERACGNKQCYGVAVLGRYADLDAIVQRFRTSARVIYFPYPERLPSDGTPGADETGELLLLFPIDSGG